MQHAATYTTLEDPLSSLSGRGDTLREPEDMTTHTQLLCPTSQLHATSCSFTNLRNGHWRLRHPHHHYSRREVTPLSTCELSLLTEGRADRVRVRVTFNIIEHTPHISHTPPFFASGHRGRHFFTVTNATYSAILQEQRHMCF